MPHLPSEAVDRAFAALESFDVALVPSSDGGYCAVGLRAEADVFSGIPMSTASVLRDTLLRAENLGLSAHLLPESFDVDEPDDVLALDDLIRRGLADLPFTRAALRKILG